VGMGGSLRTPPPAFNLYPSLAKLNRDTHPRSGPQLTAEQPSPKPAPLLWALCGLLLAFDGRLHSFLRPGSGVAFSRASGGS
jgi:hypothetical protein